MIQKQNVSAESELKSFVDKLISAKQYDVEPEVLEQMKEDLYERVEHIVNATILANTPAGKLEELDRLLDSQNKTALESFCETNIPNLQEKIVEALSKFQNSYLGTQQN
jgi:hypothetical protein